MRGHQACIFHVQRICEVALEPPKGSKRAGSESGAPVPLLQVYMHGTWLFRLEETVVAGIEAQEGGAQLPLPLEPAAPRRLYTSDEQEWVRAADIERTVRVNIVQDAPSWAGAAQEEQAALASGAYDFWANSKYERDYCRFMSPGAAAPRAGPSAASSAAAPAPGGDNEEGELPPGFLADAAARRASHLGTTTSALSGLGALRRPTAWAVAFH